LAEFLGVDTDSDPKFVMTTFLDEDIQKYFMLTEPTVENLIKFIDDVQHGVI